MKNRNEFFNSFKADRTLKPYHELSEREVNEICARLQSKLMERYPAMLDDPVFRWHYQKWILGTPIRLLRRLVRWLRNA